MRREGGCSATASKVSNTRVIIHAFHFSQASAVSRSEISRVHTELLQGVEDFLVELQARQEQQRIEEEEAAKMKKIREEQV